jgi:hypothetical protein
VKPVPPEKKRIANPARYVFGEVRNSARKRRIQFQLTFPEFLAFCERTGYLERVGREPGSLTIDRIKTDQPYRADNIRALTWLENCAHLVENMTHPAEPIARALAVANNGDPKKHFRYMKEAGKILDQVEILQRLQREEAERLAKEEAEKGPF